LKGKTIYVYAIGYILDCISNITDNNHLLWAVERFE